jgi:ABC-2 type transport system ATP-binding protein
MSDAEPVLQIENLTKRYGEFTALDRLTLSLDRGKILGMIGPNGAGKTTAIKILVGLARPSAGRARIAGEDCLKNAKKIKRLVGYMPDRFGSYDNMRVREYLDFFGAAFGVRRKYRNSRIEQVLELTNATYMKDRYVEALSHGMQQRVGIARTLLHDPEILIFDEPANGLDPEARIEMRNILLNLAAAGKTLIVTSHILPELSRICDQVAILNKGKLRASGSLADITKQFRQNRMIEVQLTSSDEIPNAEKVLTEIFGNADGISSSVTEAIVRFRSDETEHELGRVLAKLVDSKVSVSQFREIAADLEEAFLQVTREDDETPPTNPDDQESAAADQNEVAATAATEPDESETGSS